MRGFILVCLIAATAAELSGYTYNQAGGGGGSFGHSTGFINSGSIGHSTGFINSGSIGHSTGFLYSGSFVNVAGGNQLSQPIQQSPSAQQEVNKEFYTFTAPEEEFADPQTEQQVSSVSKKNLQVIFIHAPEQSGLNRAVQNFAQHTLEQQTAIYVLTKQADISQLTNNLQRESNHVAHKPEVHFVKYKTQEDAARAQQSIRAHYDALGGPSSNSDEGVAPVINFATQKTTNAVVGNQIDVGRSNPIVVGQVQAPAQTYLPTSL